MRGALTRQKDPPGQLFQQLRGKLRGLPWGINYPQPSRFNHLKTHGGPKKSSSQYPSYAQIGKA